MNRVLEHKTPSDSLRLLTNKLVVNCWSDSIFIWWLSFKDTEHILGSCVVRWDGNVMGWGGMGCDRMGMGLNGIWWGVMGWGWGVMGWSGLWWSACLGQWQEQTATLGSIARLPFPYICSPVPPEHRYLCMWKPRAVSSHRSVPRGGFFSETRQDSLWWVLGVPCRQLWGCLQSQVQLSWSGWRKVCFS